MSTDETRPESPAPAPTGAAAEPAPSPARPPRRRTGWRRWLGRLLLLLLVLLVLAVAAIGTLLGTERGLRLGLASGMPYLPAALTITSVRGSLIGPLEVRGLRYRDPALELDIHRLSFDWRPGALLARRLHVLHLDVEGVRVRPGPSAAEEAPAAPPALPDINLPVTVLLERLQITDAQLAREGVPPLELLLLRVEAAGNRVLLRELTVALPDLIVTGAGSLPLNEREPADLRLKWDWTAPEQPALAGAAHLHGPIPELRLEHVLRGAAEARLEATVAGLPGPPRWNATLHLDGVEPARLIPAAPPLLVTGVLRSEGSVAGFAASGELHLDAPDFGPHELDFAAHLAGDQVRVEQLRLTGNKGETALHATGTGRLAENPEFRIEARWQGLQWPVRGTPEAASPEGRLSLDGDLASFRFEALTRFLAPAAPEVAVELRGTGDRHRARVETLLLRLLEGSIRARGTVGWDPEPEWKLDVELAELNPGARWPEWVGSLGGALQTEGRAAAAGVEAQVRIPGIEGQLRGYPARLAGTAGVQGQRVELSGFTLASGEATLAAAGVVDQTLELRWSVDAPSLAFLLPDAGGSLEGEGTLTGPLQQPRVAALLDGSGLRFQAYGVDTLRLDADVDLGSSGPLRLELAAAGLTSGPQGLGDLRVNGSGTRQDHRLRLDLAGGAAGLTAGVELAGGLGEDGTWSGGLQRAELDTGDWGEWRLAAPAPLVLGPSTRIRDLCLVSGEGRACVTANAAQDKSWKGNLDLNNLPLALLQPFLAPEMRMVGALNGRVTAAATAAGALSADAEISLPGARLELPLGEESRDLDLSRSTARARLDGKGLTASADLHLDDLAEATARLELPRWAPGSADAQRQRVAGSLQLQVPDLAWVRAFAPELGPVAGRIAGDIRVAGTLGKPEVTGSLDLADGRLEIPDAGITLKDLQVTVRNEGVDRLIYTGSVRSGEGTLTLGGETLLQPLEAFPTRVELQGEELLVVDIPEYTARVSPNLTFSRSEGETRLDGEVLVPFARLRPRALPTGAVAPSPDVVVKGEPEVEPGPPLPLVVDVRLRLGERVSFEGFGLRGRFQGDLLVRQEPGRDPLGNGKLGIVDGVYTRFGRDLQIERGWVNYAGSPLDNPGLDVRAVAASAEVRAGVRVTGTARDPVVEVFSTPPRPQSEVLAFLVFGRPLTGGGSAADRARLQDAAALAGGGLLAAEVGRRLGLDEFSLAGGEDGAAAVTVGQYLTPRIYLQYISSLRGAVNRLRIRYELSKRLQLQTESGDQQAADLFFTFER